MSEIPVDRERKRDDFEYLYSRGVACCNWLDRPIVTMLCNYVEGMATASTVLRHQQGSATVITVLLKMCNKQMDGVDLIDQRDSVYRLDQKSTFSFIWAYIFNVIDVVNSYIIYKMTNRNYLTQLDFKTIV